MTAILAESMRPPVGDRRYTFADPLSEDYRRAGQPVEFIILQNILRPHPIPWTYQDTFNAFFPVSPCEPDGHMRLKTHDEGGMKRVVNDIYSDAFISLSSTELLPPNIAKKAQPSGLKVMWSVPITIPIEGNFYHTFSQLTIYAHKDKDTKRYCVELDPVRGCTRFTEVLSDNTGTPFHPDLGEYHNIAEYNWRGQFLGNQTEYYSYANPLLLIPPKTSAAGGT